MLSTPIARLRIIGLIESLSSFALFFIAMPIKWVPFLIDLKNGVPLDQAEEGNGLPVTIVGSIHGGLFILFVLALLHVIWAVGLPWATTWRAVLASLLPFPFEPLVLDPRLRARQQELEAQANPSPAG